MYYLINLHIRAYKKWQAHIHTLQFWLFGFSPLCSSVGEVGVIC